MMIHTTEVNCEKIAWLDSGEPVIRDAQSALDRMMTARYETGCSRFAVSKTAFAEDFFILSTGLAGEILQKLINYRMKIAIWGDFSGYTSRPLRDFKFESNNGNDVFFVQTKDEEIERLSRAEERR